MLKILNNNFNISDGGPVWLETDEDFERTTDEILNWDKYNDAINAAYSFLKKLNQN